MDIALPFITKSNPYIPNRIVHSTLVDYLILCKVHGSSQLTEILEPEFCLVGFFSPKSNTMVGKSIYLFRKQPTGYYRSVSSSKDLANFRRPMKALNRQEGAPWLSGAPTVTILWRLGGYLVFWNVYETLPHPTGNALSLVSRETSLWNSAPPPSSLKSVSGSQTALDPSPMRPKCLYTWGPSLRKRIQNYNYKAAEVKAFVEWAPNEGLLQKHP